MSTTPTNERAGAAPKPRVAVALVPRTETEVVALVAALDALGALDRFDIIVPALDVDHTRARVCALLPDAHTPQVEPIHEYLRKGHDRAVLADDDVGRRGRSMAALLAIAAHAGSAARDRGPSPAAVVAWMARSWALEVPEALRSDDVLLRSWTGDAVVQAGEELSDPAGVRYLERHVSSGDVAFDATPGAGAMTVRLGRLVGPRGHVVATTDVKNAERLRDSLAFNGVSASTEVVTIEETANLADVLSKCGHVDLLRIDDPEFDTAYLEAAAAAMLERRVGRLLIRTGPHSLRPDPDPVRGVFDRMRDQAGAAFAVVAWDGSVRTAPLDDLLREDEIMMLAAEMTVVP